MSEGFKSYRNALFIATLSSRSQKRAPPIIFSFSLSLSLSLASNDNTREGFSSLSPPSNTEKKKHDCEHEATQERE